MIIESIVQQHAEEAAYLWTARDAAACRPHYNLKDLVGADERVEAHIDGLRIAGDAAWEICRAQLATSSHGELFPAAVLAFEGSEESRVQLVLETAAQTPELVRVVVSALGWIPYNQVTAQLQRLLRAQSPTLRRIGIAGYAVHRQDLGPSLAKALSHDDLPLRTRALRAAAELGRTDLLPMVRARLTDANDHCRFAAASAAVLLSDRSAITVLQSLSTLPALSEKAVILGMRAANIGAAREWQRTLSSDAHSRRLAILAAGHIGDPAAVPWVIEQMSVPEHARIAGEALTFITGVDLSYDNLDSKAPPDFVSGPSDDSGDENVDMDADEDLPWPDTTKVEAWWGQNRGLMQPGVRHLHGKPITPSWMTEVVKIGRQRQRAAAAVELVLANPGQPLFEVRAPGVRQQRALGIHRF